MWQERRESSTGSGRRERLLSRFVQQIGIQLIPRSTQMSFIGVAVIGESENLEHSEYEAFQLLLVDQ